MLYNVSMDFQVQVEAESSDEAVAKVKGLTSGATSYASRQSINVHSQELFDSPGYPMNPCTGVTPRSIERRILR